MDKSEFVERMKSLLT